MSDDGWKLCSSCKKPIDYGAKYWVCSVSTCNRSRTALYFCRVACWDAHLPLVRHRSSAYAIEKRAPSRAQWEKEQAAEAATAKPAPAKKKVSSGTSTQTEAPSLNDVDLPVERLVVASRLKIWVADLSEMRTAANSYAALSHLIRRECEQAVRNAIQDGRKTVKARDFVRPPAGTNAGEVLVITSKVKNWIKARADLRTGGDVEDILSAHVRGWTREAIRAARSDGRGTIMDRDFDNL